jgi:hypothetical protein
MRFLLSCCAVAAFFFSGGSCGSAFGQDAPIDVLGGSVVLHENTNTLTLTIKVAGDLESGGQPSFGWDLLCPEIPWIDVCGVYSQVFSIASMPDWESTGMVVAYDYRDPNRTLGMFPSESYETTVVKFGQQVDVTAYAVDLPADLVDLSRTDYRFNAWAIYDPFWSAEGLGEMQINVPEPSAILSLLSGTILVVMPRAISRRRRCCRRHL